MKSCLRPSLPWIAAEIALDLICTALLALGPYFQKLLFDTALPGGLQAVLVLCGAYLFVQLVYSICSWLCMKATWKGAIWFERSLKRRFFHALLAKSKVDFFSRDTGEYLAMQSSDITALEQDYLQPLVDVIRSFNMFVVYGIILFTAIDWRIGLVIFLATLVVLAGPHLTGKASSRTRQTYQEAVGTYTSAVQDWLAGFSAVNRFTGPAIEAAHEAVLGQTADKRYAYGKAKSLALGVDTGAVRFLQAAAFAIVAILLCLGKISVGTAVAAFGYVECFLDPLNSILYDVSTLQGIKETRQRFEEFTASAQEQQAAVLPAPSSLKDALELQNVRVSRGSFTFGPVSLRLEKGKKYALIGANGTGKSTLFKLITGEVLPDSGCITLDGQPIGGLDTTQVIACVTQREHLFRTSARENITVYGAYPLQKAVQAAAHIKLPFFEKALRDDIANCQELSGGEQEAIAYLRMAAQDCDIVLLDEPFAAADVNATHAMEQHLLTAPEMKNKTVVVITHDHSEHLEQYDEVLQMKDGAIVSHHNETFQ